MRNLEPHMQPLQVALCELIADLLRGGRHSRRTVARITGRSLATADRWLEAIETLPGARRVKIGKTAWVEIPQPEPWKAKKRLRSPPPDVHPPLRASPSAPRRRPLSGPGRTLVRPQKNR